MYLKSLMPLWQSWFRNLQNEGKSVFYKLKKNYVLFPKGLYNEEIWRDICIKTVTQISVVHDHFRVLLRENHLFCFKYAACTQLHAVKLLRENILMSNRFQRFFFSSPPISFYSFISEQKILCPTATKQLHFKLFLRAVALKANGSFIRGFKLHHWLWRNHCKLLPCSKWYIL